MKRVGLFLTIILLLAAVVYEPIVLAAGTINEYPLSGLGLSPFGITTGADGNLWIAERTGNIAKMSNSGTLLATYPISGSQPFEITKGPDGNVWFTDGGNNAIGRITPSGTITEFTTGIDALYEPQYITLGADGNLWFTGITSDKIDKITPSGVVTEYTDPGSNPTAITTGADGNVWFTDGAGISQITPSGTITPFSTGSNDPNMLTAGPDGNIWFNSWNHKIIGKMTTSGTITTYATPTDADYYGMAAGPDGNVWFSDTFNDEVGVITPTGAVTEYATPTSGSGPAGITAGPDGNVWFSEQGTDLIGEYVLVDPTTQAPSVSSSVVVKSDIVRSPDTGYGSRNQTVTSTTTIIFFSIGVLFISSGLLIRYRQSKATRNRE